MDLQVCFHQFVSQNALATKKDHILVAVSGGKDSILLLHLLLETGFDIGVAHCNFNLRGAESDEEEQFVQGLCKQYGIRFHQISFEPERYAEEHQISIQMACRDLRYAWFEKIAVEYGYTQVATAHHGNDQVETFIINLLRGTGLEGLKGIPVRRGIFIRPLLFMNSADIQQAVSERQLIYRDDSSNFSRKYLRNQIRLDVIPELQKLNPNLQSTIVHTMGILGEVSDFVKNTICTWKEENFVLSSEGIQVSLQALLKLQPRQLWMFELFRNYNFSAAVIQDLVRHLHEEGRQISSGVRFESPSHVIFVDREQILLQEKSSNTSLDMHTLVIECDSQKADHIWNQYRLFFETSDSSGGQKQKTASVNFFQVDQDLLQWPLSVRSWQKGDSFQPLGMHGKHKKISDLFVSKKIPEWQKSQIPVLFNADGQVIWVLGLQGSDVFKITDHTNNVLTISYFCTYGEQGE